MIKKLYLFILETLSLIALIIIPMTIYIIIGLYYPIIIIGCIIFYFFSKKKETNNSIIK